MARFNGTGAYQTTVTFRLATAITDDGEGGDASGTSSLTIPIRLAPVSGQNEVVRIREQFPNAGAYQSTFYGWVDDKRKYTFPAELRKQDELVGECETPKGKGRLMVAVADFPIEVAAKKIGEKFTAVWTKA